ncbi:MAG: hypothetical protein ACREM3_21505, partial [Candidatus Rokuibacteriota bacterium]
MTWPRGSLLRMLVLVAAAAWLAACALPRGAPPPVTRSGERLAGREFLLPGQRESTSPEPYALYSYLLFG